MDTEIRSRLAILVVLAVVGVCLAGVGTSFGVGSAGTGSNAEFVVGADNVTVTNGKENATVVGNISNVSHIEIRRVDSTQFQVSAERQTPLNATERKQAVEIARHNETVRQLGVLDDSSITVSPVPKISTGQLTAIDTDNSTGETTTFTARVDTELNETDDGAVVRRATRDRYVDNRAVVLVDHPETGELQYSITVDLANRSVVSVVDQAALRRNVSAEPTSEQSDS
ncbi:hypothetical protein C440_02683 [Haloferax mucosum ATCC BAA-1512]|uniref:Uncharacterized protein n=1 Tax=Haloferax mucosum ATCC BAA-1512 TaxID=662479 RepID=M0IQL7_9EURY|nr:hypothetical protein [Haloferax mucosum]ELZ98118.1 hypothetical protein C440_02683 [Haloferax mucosum ATCC BAA-1512]